MLFSEIYGSYYNAVAKILTEAVNGELTDSKIYKIISEYAFSESTMSIPQHLKDHTWPLLLNNNTSVLKSAPETPLTDLQKRWLKSILLDPRIKLFSPDIKGLENTEPLYLPEDIIYFDTYTDGDPYNDPEYIKHFKTILEAFKQNRMLKIEYPSRLGEIIASEYSVKSIEYSNKDDKFRINVTSGNRSYTLNMNRIRRCEAIPDKIIEKQTIQKPTKEELNLELIDERNTLQRVMMHFSHLEKETKQIENNRYSIKLKYYLEDEAEILIRVLSFGPMIKVISPNNFKEKIKSRLLAQKNFETPLSREKNNKYIYIGCFLDQSKLNALIKDIRKNPLTQTIANPHITIKYKPSTVDERLFGEKIRVKVIGYGNDGNNEGLSVELYSDNKAITDIIAQIRTPHITLSLGPYGKAVDTHSLRFEPIAPFYIDGTFSGVVFSDK